MADNARLIVELIGGEGTDSVHDAAGETPPTLPAAQPPVGPQPTKPPVPTTGPSPSPPAQPVEKIGPSPSPPAQPVEKIGPSPSPPAGESPPRQEGNGEIVEGAVQGGITGAVQGGTIGAARGAITGGLMGAAVGPVGAVVGAVTGAAVGGAVGATAGGAVGAAVGGTAGAVKKDKGGSSSNSVSDEDIQRSEEERKFRDNARYVGQSLQAFSKNDHIKSFGVAVDAGAKAIGAISSNGSPAAAALKKFGAVTKEAAEVVHAFTERGRELARYNADLARVTAEANARKLLADVREADKTGKNVGRMIEAESQISTAAQDMAGGFKGALASIGATVTEGVAAGFEIIKPVVEGVGDFVHGFTDAVLDPFNKLIEGVNGVREELYGQKIKEEQKQINGILAKWIEQMEAMPIGDGVPLNPANPNPEQLLKLPTIDFGD